jgi:uroporphyrinogen-III synthase
MPGTPSPASGDVTAFDNACGVVVTRPRAQAGALAAALAAAGHRVELLPLLDIHPLADTGPLQAVLAGLASYDLVAFVSPNAIEAAFAHLPSSAAGAGSIAWPAGVTIAVLGEGSRATLAGYGLTPANTAIVSPPDSAASDSEHLLAAMDLAALRGRRVLIVRGESGRELMADGLRAAGAEVTVAAAYRRSVPVLTPALAAQLLHLLARPQRWIMTSSEALRGLVDLLSELDRQQPGSDAVVRMQQQALIVPHARIAQTANGLGFTRVTLTGSGDERLLAALQLQP